MVFMSQTILFRFNPLKSAQVAAYFLNRHGGKMDKYIALKMIYLADREALLRWNVSITGDSPVSMRFGPVPSRIYDLTKPEEKAGKLAAIWKPIINTKTVEVLEVISNPGTSELSEEEMDLLNEIYDSFGAFTFEQMKDHCHGLAEYDKAVCDAPQGSRSKPISIESLLTAIGKSKQEIEGIRSEEKGMRLLERVFRK
jgi:hypothetical protein